MRCDYKYHNCYVLCHCLLQGEINKGYSCHLPDKMNETNEEWLTADFLANSLQGDDKQRKIIVLAFNKSSVVPPGNNYGSFIQRVKVDFKEENDTNKVRSVSLIVKAPLEDEKLRENLKKLYDCEPRFYNEYIPAAQQLINHNFIPKSYPSLIHQVIVMEDLKDQGYVMVDKSKQLDFEHCLLYVTAAATFHAASFAVYKKNPGLIQFLGQEKVFKDLGDTFENMIKDGLKCMLQHVLNLPQGNKYFKVLKDCYATLWDNIVDAHKPSGDLNCLTQGDPWATNMMFRYDDTGKVTDIKLVDFQALRYGSPANDVAFFLWSSANHHVRKHALNDLYKTYVEHLNKNLKALNCTERMPYDSFMENIKRYSPMVLSVAATSIPIILNPDPVDFHSAAKESENKEKKRVNLIENFYNKKYCETHLPQVVESLAAAGVFEYLENFLTAKPD